MLVSLSEEQRRLIDVLLTHRQGMTLRQLQAKLSQPSTGVQSLLESLLESRMVTRLNTLVPSYMYRSGGVDLNVE
jgi:hypothetical protein